MLQRVHPLQAWHYAGRFERAESAGHGPLQRAVQEGGSQAALHLGSRHALDGSAGGRHRGARLGGHRPYKGRAARAGRGGFQADPAPAPGSRDGAREGPRKRSGGCDPAAVRLCWHRPRDRRHIRHDDHAGEGVGLGGAPPLYNGRREAKGRRVQQAQGVLPRRDRCPRLRPDRGRAQQRFLRREAAAGSDPVAREGARLRDDRLRTGRARAADCVTAHAEAHLFYRAARGGRQHHRHRVAPRDPAPLLRAV
mmetsp:Transcript_65487/g.146119  ORF Transcript_65487/g.146119 Transcript_65487/m.146119 type:complete len:252 (+) Transcript_65487:697-1452(+)